MRENIYKNGKKLGLNKKDIDKILRGNSSRETEHSKYSVSVDIYKSGGKYGTISIYEF